MFDCYVSREESVNIITGLLCLIPASSGFAHFDNIHLTIIALSNQGISQGLFPSVNLPTYCICSSHVVL